MRHLRPQPPERPTAVEQRKEMSSALDEKLAAGLATALAYSPRANLQQIAKSAGISKATLYRIAPTREGLVEMLMERAINHLEAALDAADLASPPFPAALKRLTDRVMTHRGFYLFWNSAQWEYVINAKTVEPENPLPLFYGRALEDFFLRGQQAGAFRIDMPAKWLAKSYDYLIHAAADAAQRGEVAPVGMSEMVQKMFLQGASQPARTQ